MDNGDRQTIARKAKQLFLWAIVAASIGGIVALAAAGSESLLLYGFLIFLIVAAALESRRTQ